MFNIEGFEGCEILEWEDLTDDEKDCLNDLNKKGGKWRFIIIDGIVSLDR